MLNNKKYKKILILPNFGLGDAIIALQVAYKMKIVFPNAEINCISWSGVWRKVYEDTKYIDNILVLRIPNNKIWSKENDAELFYHVETLLKEMDFVISLCEIKIIEDMIVTTKRQNEFIIWNFSNKLVDNDSIYTNISETINVSLDLWNKWYPITPPALTSSELDTVREWCKKNCDTRKIAIIVVSAGPRNFKGIPRHVFIQIYLYLLLINYLPILIMPKEEESKKKYTNLINKYPIKYFESDNIRDIFVLIFLSNLYIGPDTGFSHSAALFNIPTISIFGPSMLFFRPYGRFTDVINLSERCEFKNRGCVSCTFQKMGTRCLNSFFEIQRLQESLIKFNII